MIDTDAGAFDRFEAAAWGSSAKAQRYGDFFIRTSTLWANELLDSAGVSAGKRVLDLGCGPGNIAALAAARGADVVGADHSEEMLTVARKAHPAIPFRWEDAQSLTLPDDSFDSVVANLLVFHVGRPDRVVSEMRRILRRSGRAATTVWSDNVRSRFTGLFFDAVTAADASPPADLPKAPPLTELSANDGLLLRQMFEAAGFVDVQAKRVDCVTRISNTDEYWDGFIASSVRIAALITSQHEAVRRRIRAEFGRLTAGYRDGDGLAIPVSVVIGTGTCPDRMPG